MSSTVFAEVKFWLLIFFSAVLPVGIHVVLLMKRAMSRATILILGLTLVVVAGVDVWLLQILAESAKLTPSLADDAVFLSEVSLALYLLPAMFGGIGVRFISDILVKHLGEGRRTTFGQWRQPMNSLLVLVGWLVLLVLCWPLALLALLVWPLVWLISLPFRLIGLVFEALFAFLRAVLLPARALGYRARS